MGKNHNSCAWQPNIKLALVQLAKLAKWLAKLEGLVGVSKEQLHGAVWCKIEVQRLKEAPVGQVAGVLLGRDGGALG